MSNNFPLSSGYSFCDFEIKRGTPIHAYPSLGAYTLNIPITFKVFSSSVPKVLTSINGELHLNSKFITEINPSYSGSIIQSSDNNSLELQANFRSVFTKANIDAVEIFRSGNDLQFEIKLFGDIFDLNSTDTSARNIIQTSGNLNHRMLQAEWIEILNTWKYAPTLNLELVLNFENPYLAKAADFVSHAQKFFLERQWSQAVSECRKAIDVVIELLKKENVNFKSLLENKHSNTMQERLLLSLFAVKQVCDPASHGDSNSTKIIWSQDDAIFVIRMTASILMRAAKERV